MTPVLFTVRSVDPSTGRALTDPVPRRPRPPKPPPGEPRVQDPYPETGTSRDVLTWVGYDPGRAKAAIAAEHDRGKPRTTLLTELSERTG